jgi:ketosteroid isomerase-like protein
MIMKIFALMFALCTLGAAQHHRTALELAQAERDFSATSDSVGIRESFLRYLSDDAVMFNPHPVNGKELYRNRKESGAHLTWYPSFVEVARSGDFGISTGPWEIRRSKKDSVGAVGHYFSVWKKMKNGHWKVIVDNGSGYEKDQRRKETHYFGVVKGTNTPQQSADARQKSLRSHDETFALRLKDLGTKQCYQQFGAENLRLYRSGNYPTSKKQDAVLIAAKDRPASKSIIQGMNIASSGDLGYVYGVSIDAKNDSSTFVRVWRFDDGWKLAVDMLDPYTR